MSFFKTATISMFIFLTGCASTENRVRDQNRSVTELRKYIVAVMGEARWIGNGGRELHSQYFNPAEPGPEDEISLDSPDISRPVKSAANKKQRKWAQVRIIGDRRPYDVEIAVIVEKVVNGKYVAVDTDKELEKKFKQELAERLNKGQEGYNIIDDFRAF